MVGRSEGAETGSQLPSRSCEMWVDVEGGVDSKPFVSQLTAAVNLGTWRNLCIGLVYTVLLSALSLSSPTLAPAPASFVFSPVHP
jgi:hypothetical protein